MKLDANGVNEHGVQMCDCKRNGPIHAWEPGEWCGPLVVPAGPDLDREREEIVEAMPCAD